MAQAKIAGGLDKMTVIFGDSRGADAHAHNFCKVYKVDFEKHDAEWETYGKKAGPVRNAMMVASGADICLAFPRGKSDGTLDCATKARAAKMPVIFG